MMALVAMMAFAVVLFIIIELKYPSIVGTDKTVKACPPHQWQYNVAQRLFCEKCNKTVSEVTNSNNNV